MNRTLLMIRSAGFAFVTKLSGAATVFVALPLVARGVSPSDYAVFLTTMNVAAIGGLVFAPYAALFIRELAHAFARDDAKALRVAVRRCFNAHAALVGVVATGFVAIGAALAFGWSLKPAMAVGVALNLLQVAASFGQLYRIAERTDHVTSLVQTAANLVLVGALLALAHFGRLNDLSVCLVYFGVPAAAELAVFTQVARARRLPLGLGRRAFADLAERIPESLPLYLSPIADYIKVYAAAMLALLATNTHEYIVFSTAALMIARLVNPLTLVTRPLMPAFIDAFQRGDEAWLRGLRRALVGGALLGALAAAALPFLVSKQVFALALPKEAGDISTAFIVFCAFFAYSYALTALLAPLYIGARRAPFYGIANLAFTVAGAGLGTVAATRFGASGMMCCLAVLTTACGVLLLAAMDWRGAPQASATSS